MEQALQCQNASSNICRLIVINVLEKREPQNSMTENLTVEEPPKKKGEPQKGNLKREPQNSMTENLTVET